MRAASVLLKANTWLFVIFVIWNHMPAAELPDGIASGRTTVYSSPPSPPRGLRLPRLSHRPGHPTVVLSHPTVRSWTTRLVGPHESGPYTLYIRRATKNVSCHYQVIPVVLPRFSFDLKTLSRSVSGLAAVSRAVFVEATLGVAIHQA